MKWDVFISHASEDKDFARKLVSALEEFGLKVWFDEMVLNAGDSLRRSIDQGLSESEFGIVIFSNNFFAKEWPKKELDGLVAREDGKQKVIIPIWHNITAEEVKNFSPSLADKLSIYSNGSIDSIVEKLLRAIYKERAKDEHWPLQTKLLSNNTEVVLLPIRPAYDLAIGFGRYPVTNEQYKKFVDDTGKSQPIGETFQDGAWHGPFVPWDDVNFNNPEQPVVCVDFKDARDYCIWINKLINSVSEFDFSRKKEGIFIPMADLWDWAAWGPKNSTSMMSKKVIPNTKKNIHKAKFPANINRLEARDNEKGISDMFGNIWEWCGGNFEAKRFISILEGRRKRTEVQLRGGGFLDDLNKIRPYLTASMLKDGRITKHTDLGFRIASLLSIKHLSKEEVVILNMQDPLPSTFWQDCLFNIDSYNFPHKFDYYE